ncbi:MurR/RpiR family transcriptional regulator [Carnobacterium maltaromaticum]|uniref:MurR/RpiR family transcriptional regulator n=1 Tax=Carnobacterium maltaromaticum TaxID=2751 RepID=UPI0012F8713F|nr:MurR/RpiR family transcriptional regulator [Carnobacterium maltaromaticum]
MSEFSTQKYQKSGVHLSSSEKYVLTYIENNLAKIPAISIVKLSEEANVSTATIVRAMKKIGYDGFTSFKHHLKDAEEQNPTFAIMEQVDKKIQEAIIKNEQEVTRTIQLLDSGTIEDALQKIKAASKISIFARGFSELIAKEMAIKFQLMGKHCDLHDDPNIIRSISKKIKSTEIVIFISLSGETPELIEAAKNCQKQNVSTITFTANQDGPLIKLSELIFVGYKSAISYFPDYEVRSRLPLQVMTRILLDSYASRFVSD